MGGEAHHGLNMAYNLAAMARQAGIKRDITLRPVTPAVGPEQDLARLYLAVLKAWNADAILRGYTGGMTTDAPSDQTNAIAEAENTVARLIAEFTRGLRDWLVRTEVIHRSRFVASVMSGTGLDLTYLLSGGEVQETLQVALDRNVALVRNISDQARGRIADAVWRGYQNRLPARDVAKEIREATGFARARSIRVASDQNSKLSAALDRDRQAQAGIDLFRWAHSRKAHPRLDHVAKNGQIYERASGKQVNPDGTPMPGGDKIERGKFPGEEPFCGCRASAYLAIFSELGI